MYLALIGCYMHLGIHPFVHFLLIFPGEYPVMASSLLRSRYTRNHLAPVVQKLDTARSIG